MKTIFQVTNEIKEFKIQGANQIALYGLIFLKDVLSREGFGKRFISASQRLERARPTAVVLHNCIKIIMSEPSISTINSLIVRLQTVAKRESVYSDKIIKSNSRIITYCHSGEAMSFIKHASMAHKKKISVTACKTDPLRQGIITAKELKEAKIPVTLIDDNAIGFFMKDQDMVIIGADALRKEGVVNKIGTSLLAQAAHESSKPLYVVANLLKIDRRKRFEIEERSPDEIKKNLDGKNLAGIRIRNPAFDITPWKHVTCVINENGIFTRKKLGRLL